MKTFLQLLTVACVGLLSWWQATLRGDLELATVVLLSAGVLAAVLTWRSIRAGYWIAAALGAGYLAEIVLMVEPQRLVLVQPLLAWSVGLLVCSAALLWATRERKATKPLYERYPEY